MLIVCPTCATAYQIQLAALGASGRSVRCSNCRNTWFATADSVIEEAALVPAASNREPPPPQQQATGERANSQAGDPAVEDTPAPDDVASREPENALAVTDAPPLVPQDEVQPEAEAPVAKFDPGTPEDIETIAARRARHSYADRKERRTTLQRLTSLPTLIVVMLVILAAALNGRMAMVRHFPQTASLFAMIGMPVNLRGLTFESVKSTSEFQDGVMVQVIDGRIVNPTGHTLEVPRLRFALRNSAGLEVYAWTALPSKTLLGPGDELPFRTRLASPPPDGRDVIVRFFNRRDVGAGSL